MSARVALLPQGDQPMTSPSGLKLLKAREVAELLQISPWTVTALCRSGQLRASMVAKSWRIEEAAVREYLAAQQNTQTNGVAPTRRRRRRAAS